MNRLPQSAKLGVVLFFFAFLASAVALYGGAQLVDTEDQAAASEDDGSGGVPGGPAAFRLVAKDLKFDKRSVTASTGAPVTVTLDNQDAGVLHNIGFYTNSGATSRIFVSETFPGPMPRDFNFPAPAAPGNYFFRCDVHPDTMTGTFSVR